jgi:hypothetical protein
VEGGGRVTVKSESDVVLEHALLNEENLAVAAAIGEAYEELCGRVVAGVLRPLSAELTARLGAGWRVTAFLDPVRLAERSLECLTARRNGDPASLRVVLAADEAGYPKKPYLAVRADDPAKVAGGVMDQVKRAIDARYRSGRASAYSVWYRYLDNPYATWGTPDGLVRLYRTAEAVAFFTEHLEQLARAVEAALSPTLQPESPNG